MLFMIDKISLQQKIANCNVEQQAHNVHIVNNTKPKQLFTINKIRHTLFNLH